MRTEMFGSRRRLACGVKAWTLAPTGGEVLFSEANFGIGLNCKTEPERVG